MNSKYMRVIAAIGTVCILLMTSGCIQQSENHSNQTSEETIAEKFEASHFGIAISHFGSDYLTRMPEDLLGANSHWAGSLLVRWYEIEPSKDNFNWDELDYYLGEIGDKINLLLELRLYNDWASVGGCNSSLAGSPIKTGYQDDLADFLKLLVKKVSSKVKYYSIGNEMEIEQFWCCSFCKTREESAAEYLKILKIAYDTIKEEDSDAVILLGGFTGNWNGGETDNWPEVTNTNPDFVDYVLKNGKDYFDILDIHLYGEAETYKERVDWFKSLMNKYGYSKPIWSTEMGGPDIRVYLDSLDRNKTIEENIIANNNTKMNTINFMQKRL